jgi:hypothetical protein
MTEYSRIAKGNFISTGTAQVINLPFQPDYVEMINYTNSGGLAATSQNIVRAYWDATVSLTVSAVNYNPTIIEGYNTTPALIYDAVLTNGISTFSAGQLLQYGPLYAHNSVASADFAITAASPAVVTTQTAHGLATGNVIIFENLYQTSTTGMIQMAGVPLTVTVTDSTHFSVNWNASGSTYAAFNTSTSTNNVGSFKQVLYPYLYAPEQAIITAINTSTSTVTTAAAHNYKVGQIIAFRIPPIWGSTQLNSLPNVQIPGQPLYYYVIAETQNTFTVSASMSGVTAFNANFNGGTVLPVGAFTFPQVVAIGDVNTGAQQISAGSSLYPAPILYNGSGTAKVSTINGPAIVGSFVNNTSQGFIIGAGAGRVLTTGNLVGASGNVIYWRAYLSDLAVN